MTATQVPIIGWEDRYMTPTECKRLQSMDTLELPESDTRAYAALGNAINVRVAELVAEALVGRAGPAEMLQSPDQATSKASAVKSSDNRTFTEWIQRFQSAVLDWFALHQRDFPWRRTSNPFHILVAEVLLRQTQAERIAGPYLELIKRYSDAQQMAGADVGRLREWFRPLGLVKRADRLVEAAKGLLEKHGGQVPEELEALMKLPGLGRYSARAIVCLAFGRSVPMIDESSGRLLQRVLGLTYRGPAYSDRQLLACAEELIPPRASRAFNLGLLDIAACYCHPSAPNCAECPLLNLCSYGQRVKVEQERVGGHA